MSLSEQSANKDIPAILGGNTASGFGVFGKSDLGVGVHGENEGGNSGPDRGVGVWGESQKGFGVFGSSDNFVGLKGVSKIGVGVNGINGGPGANRPDRGCGVFGESIDGFGVFGSSNGTSGVKGVSTVSFGVHGINGGISSQPDRGSGVFGESVDGYGLFASSDNHFGIKAVSKNGVGLSAEGSRLAAFFRGDVEVTGDIRLTNADCAEDFDILEAEQIDPGTVMVVGEEGTLHQSHQAYDKRVAGVISGAGDFKPGLVLDKQHSQLNRKPIALLGKVYCKVDASHAPIEVGDLLTTAPTPGHAMKVTDPTKAFGAVIGKALRPMEAGQGTIPILIALQ